MYNFDHCEVVLCLIGLATGVLCVLMGYGHQDTKPLHAKPECREVKWQERWKTNIEKVFCEITLCFAILLMGCGLRARSPWGGERRVLGQVIWIGFVIDVGLVLKIIWISHWQIRTRKKCLQMIKSERELEELERFGKMKEADEARNDTEEKSAYDRDVQGLFTRG
ncbi:hypothetical protein IFR05_014314 [Cadophora sp. M221]|nr:hypothetical protein IFR05_014314 [Cadophora sp. M221]